MGIEKPIKNKISVLKLSFKPYQNSNEMYSTLNPRVEDSTY